MDRYLPSALTLTVALTLTLTLTQTQTQTLTLTYRLQQAGHSGHGQLDEGVVVDVGEHRHHHLTVHSVRQPAVPGDAVAEVLDLERALEPRREEPACYGGQRRQTLVSPEKFSLTTK